MGWMDVGLLESACGLQKERPLIFQSDCRVRQHKPP